MGPREVFLFAVKSHTNIVTAVLLKLNSIGVPSGALPVDDKHELLVDSHFEWIACQDKRENEEREPSRKRSRAVRGSNANEDGIAYLLAHTAAMSELFDTSSAVFNVG